MFKLLAEHPVAVFLCSSCEHVEALLRKTFLPLQQGLPRETQMKIFRMHESRTMRTRRSSHPPTCASGGLVLLELSPLVVHLLRLLLVLLPLSLSPSHQLLDLGLIALLAFLVFLFLLRILHEKANGEAYELRMLFRQIPLSEFLQELGLVLSKHQIIFVPRFTPLWAI